MAISRRPPNATPAPDAARPASEQDVFNLINKGGSVAKATALKADADDLKPMLVQLRLYPALVAEIDAVRKAPAGNRYRTPSRHAWIVSAIEEKLARDKAGI